MEKFKMVEIKRLKKMDKSEAYDTVIAELNDLVRFYFRYGVVPAGRAEQTAIFDRMKDQKNYARYIKHALKEESNPFPDGFNFILAEFIQRFGREATTNDELADVCLIYSEVVEKICKSHAKHIAKDLDVPKDIAMEIAIIYPGSVLSKHNAWVFSSQLNRRLMSLQKKCCPIEVAATKTTEDVIKEDTESKVAKPVVTEVIDTTFSRFDFADKRFIKNLFKGYFGKDEEVLERVYGSLMLDRQAMTLHYNESQKRLWSAMTEVMLTGIEKLPIKTVKNIAENYVRMRNRAAEHGRENDPQRRVVVQNLEFEKSPKLVTVFNPDEYSFKDALKHDGKKAKKGKKKDKKKKKH